MSPNYSKQIADLAEWFKVKLAGGPDIAITQTEYSGGTDMLQEPYKTMLKEAFDLWLKERNYELSYNQMCNGFFAAARHLGKLVVAGARIKSDVPMRQISRQNVVIRGGTFVRVKADHENPARAGKDGMVTEDVLDESQEIGLVFYRDRHNESQDCECVGPEAWSMSELDLSTLER